MKRKMSLAIGILFFVVSCAATTQTSIYKGIALTRVTAESIIKAAKEAKANGQLTDMNFQAIAAAYEKGRKANDAVIDAMKVALDLGIQPETSPSYIAAFADFNKVFKEIVDLAIMLGLIKGGA